MADNLRRGLGLGGQITFGRNYGRWNIGFFGGFGLGAMVDVVPAAIEPGFASEGTAVRFGAEASGGAKLYSLGVSGAVQAEAEADFSGNVDTHVGLSGGGTIPYGDVVNLSGTVDIVAQGNTNRLTGKYRLDMHQNPVSYGLGGMGLVGPKGGVAWGTSTANRRVDAVTGAFGAYRDYPYARREPKP